MKRCIFIICLVILANTVAFAEPPEISGECACMIEAKSGRVVYSKNEDMRHAMASTTKIMTAIIALEECEADEVVEISRNAADTEGSSVYVEAGERIRMEDLVYGLMLNSGNDAAVAIAEHISGNVEEFCGKMNKKAKEIGADDTSFKNPNGLFEEGHYTTARDLAEITRYAMKNDTFCKIVATKSKTVKLDGSEKELYFGNHNKLLWNYDGAIGVKTGYTKDTGRCLVSAAEREGCRLIAVTLDAPNDWTDHKLMLDYGFSTLESRVVIEENQVMKTAEINGKQYDFVAEKPSVISFEKDGGGGVTINLKISSKLTGAFNKGEKVGVADVTYNGELLDSVNIVSAEDITDSAPKEIVAVEKKSFWRSFADVFVRFFIEA